MTVIDRSVVQILPDFSGFKNALRRGLAEATSGANSTVKIGLDVDARSLDRQVREAAARSDTTVKVKLDVDRSALDKLGASGGGGGGGGGGISLGGAASGGIGGAGSAASAAIRPMTALWAAAAALSPVLVGVASAAVQASTSVVALGAAGYGATLGVVGLAQAFSGVVAAVKLHDQAQKASTSTTTQGTAARNAAASAATGVEMAERSLARAQTDEARAQQAVNDARRQARIDLEDLRNQMADLVLSEEGAQIALIKAQQEQKRMMTDQKATALDRRQAALDVAEAEQRLKEIQTDRKRTTKQVNDEERKGVDSSPKVKAALQAQQDAATRVKDAQLSLKGAQLSLTRARQSGAKATKQTSAAEAQLQQALADLSPAGRKLYNWWTSHGDMFKKYRRSMESATLPGFLSFLKDVTKRGKNSKSTLDLIVSGAKGVGRETSTIVAGLGRITRTPWFRGAVTKLNSESLQSYKLLGAAALKLVKPITRIFAASSPLLVQMTKYVTSLANKFSAWMSTISDHDLAAWFKNAGDQLGKWWGIAKDLGTTLLVIFKASMPTGGDLVSKLKELTGHLRDWATSKRGQDQIESFFQFFRDIIHKIDYKKLGQIIGQAAILFGLFKATKIAGQHPVLTLLGLMAVKYPQQTADVLESISTSLGEAITYASKHPGAIKTLMALLAAYAALKGLGALPTVDGNGKSGGGGGKSLPMSVVSAVSTMMFRTRVKTLLAEIAVNTARGGMGGGPGGQGGKRGSGAVAPVLWTVAATGAEYGMSLGWKQGSQGKPVDALLRDAVNNPSPANIGKALFFGFSPIAWASWAAGRAKNASDNRNSVQGKEQASFQAVNKDAKSMWIPSQDPAIAQQANVQKYIADRKRSVEAAVEHARATDGEAAATLKFNDETGKSVATLSTLLQTYGWSKRAADDYARSTYGTGNAALTSKVKFDGLGNAVILTGDATKGAGDKADRVTPKFDGLGNALDTAAGKSKTLRDRTGQLHDKMKLVEGKHVISISSDGYAETKKQLDMLYAIQHVLYNPAYSNTAAGADTVSGQNQYLDPKTGLPKKFNNGDGYGLRRATGGPVRGRGTATSDSIPAWLSNGEYVHPTSVVQHYGVGAMDALREKKVPKELLRFASGGKVGGWPFVVNLPYKGFNVDPAAILAGPSYGPGSEQEYTGRIPKGLGAVAHLTQRMMAAVIDAHKQFPWETVTSGYRPGSITVTGNRSYHGYGRATDWLPSMGLFNYFHDKYPDARELIYSPAGARQIWNARPHVYSGKVRATHWNHVHLALANGGLVGGGARLYDNGPPKGYAFGGVVQARKYDNGGALPPGVTLAVNNTGRAENVQTAAQAGTATRLDHRDLAHLAALISSAVAGQPVTMDGRKVAEITNRYNYLPAGV